MALDIIKNTKLQNEENENGYRCRFCTVENDGYIHYHETGYGMAHIGVIKNNTVDERYLDRFDPMEADNFTIDSFECGECGEEREHIMDLFEPIPNIVNEE